MAEMGRTQEQISDGLVEYLRAELNDPEIGYVSPLTPMAGGYETSTYRFELSGVQGELSKPLVLRLYPPNYGTDSAVWESTVQSVLSDEGFPAARPYLLCTEPSILGGAFFVMELLPGALMVSVPFETVPAMLGEAHASLHSLDPAPLIEALQKRGFEEHRYKLGGRLIGLNERVGPYPWLHESVDWLLENRPPEPERLSVCHGDFHPFNLLVQDGRVTGVLDWPGFLVADPVLDVANTVVLTSISGKHLLSLRDWERVVEMYLASYRAQKPLDLAYLDYYRVRRCVIAVWEGARGHAVWRQPPIVEDLIEYIQGVTGIRILLPA